MKTALSFVLIALSLHPVSRAQAETTAPASENTQCSATATQLELPIIEITSNGEIPSSKGNVVVQGVIEGSCLISAGVFSNGSLIHGINVRTTSSNSRQTFETLVKAGAQIEIRAYNSNNKFGCYFFQAKE